MQEVFNEVVQLAVKNKTTKSVDTEVSSSSNTDTTEDTNTNSNANTNTSATTLDASNTFGNIDWQHPSWDLFLGIFFVVGALLYGVSLGKDRIIAILVSIYMALGIVETLPDFVLNIKINANFTLQVTAFVAVFVVLFFLLSRTAVLNSLNPNSQGSWWQVIIFSILHIGLLVSVTMSFLPTNLLSNFSELTRTIFTQEWARFGWVIAPIIAMIAFGKGDSAE